MGIRILGFRVNRSMEKFIRNFKFQIDRQHCLLSIALLYMIYINIQNKKSQPTDNEEYMDQLAWAAGTLKHSGHHHYTKIYPKYFGPFEKKPIKFLELGIFKGESVKLWENYFTNAELHFIDAFKDNIEYWSNRSHYHFMDLSNFAKVNTFAETTGPFDIIVDDAGHTSEQIITSFNAIFPHVKPGGIYVIEDLQTSYAHLESGMQYGKAQWNGTFGTGTIDNPKAGPGTTIDYLKHLIDDINYVGTQTPFRCKNTDIPQDIMSRMNYFSTHIESIHFYSCLCIITAR